MKEDKRKTKRRLATDVTWAILDLEPFFYRREPIGDRFSFEQLCQLADMEVCVTHPRLPDIYVHDGDRHYIVSSGPLLAYCLSSTILPKELDALALTHKGIKERFLLCLVAYGAADYFAKEVVMRDRRMKPERKKERDIPMQRIVMEYLPEKIIKYREPAD